MKKYKVDEEMVRNNLPRAPKGYSYTVERVTPRVIKVWLNHPPYLFKQDVRTIHSFIKGDKVRAPRNKEKMRVESICDVWDLCTLDSYSVINDTHDVLSLQHL